MKDKRIFLILGGLLLAIVFFVLNSSRPNSSGKAEPENVVFGSNRENESRIPGPAAQRTQTIEMSLREQKQFRFELERDGAWAEVSCRIVDRSGVPVPDADVRFFFDQPERRPESEGVVEGKSDADGRFFARKKTTYACHWRIRKEGFYEANGILPFSNHFSVLDGKKGRWTETPLELDVVLDERSGARLSHGFIYWKPLVFPTNTWVGFDFEGHDCVEPFGTGKTAHVSFFSIGNGELLDATRRGEVWTNRLIVSSPSGGIALLPEKKDSNMPFCHVAPERFDNDQIDFSYIRSGRVLFEDREMKDGEFLVFQTSRNVGSEEEPHFGIIRKLKFWPGGLRMEYFFNPTLGDRRTDADIRSKRDIER